MRSARCTFLPISGSNWYPIFLGYATGWLEKHGHTCSLIDAPVANLTHEQVYEKAESFSPKLLVLYISKDSLPNDAAVGEEIKKRTGCKIVLVGPWCANTPEKILKEYSVADIVVRREFEDAVLDIANGKPLKSIKGIIYRSKAGIVSNPERPFLTGEQLDRFPFVASVYKRHVPIENYYQASLLHPFIDMFTARGCAWNQCTFCLWPNTIHKGAMYRARSIDNVIKELHYIKKELPWVKEVFFQDDMLPSVRIRELSSRMLKEKLNMKWSCYVRANVDRETLFLMKKAGCRYLHVGYESVDPTVIKLVKKGNIKEEMERFTKDANEAGLRIHGDFILGLPGETEQSIQATIEWAKTLGIEGYQVFIPQPHEATPMYQWLKKRGYLTKDGDINYPFLSKDRLTYWRFRAMKEIYFTPSYIWNTVRHISSFSEFMRLVRTATFVLPNILFPKKNTNSCET